MAARHSSLRSISPSIAPRTRLRCARQRLGQLGIGGIRQLLGPAHPAGDIRRLDRLRLEMRIAIVAGEGAVQLGGALPKHGDQAQIDPVLLFRRGSFGGFDQADLVELAIQVLRGVDPAIALVAHKAVHDGERMPRAVLCDLLGGAEQGRRILEVRDFGQEARDLQLRMLARREAPEDLEHRVVADDHRAVALLHADAADFRRIAQVDRRQRLGRGEMGGAIGAGQVGALAHGIDQGEDELVRRERIVDRADLRTAPRLGQGEGRQGPVGRAGRLVPRDVQRQEVGLRLLARLQLQRRHQQQVVAELPAPERAEHGGIGARDRVVLGGEPALLGNEARQHRRRELVRFAPAGQAVPAVAHHQGDEFRHRLRQHVVPARLRPQTPAGRTSRSRSPAGSADRAGRRSAGRASGPAAPPARGP